MINAREARRQSKINLKLGSLKGECNSSILKTIEVGGFAITMEIPDRQLRFSLEEYLKELNYTCEQIDNRYLYIKWSE